MDKTVKIRAFQDKVEPPPEVPAEKAKPAAAPSNLVIKNPQLEEERAKFQAQTQEFQKKIGQLEQNIKMLDQNIVQLEQSLKDEKVKSATLADALKKISGMALAASQQNNQ